MLPQEWLGVVRAHRGSGHGLGSWGDLAGWKKDADESWGKPWVHFEQDGARLGREGRRRLGK